MKKIIILLFILFTINHSYAVDVNALGQALKGTNISDYQESLPEMTNKDVDVENPGAYTDNTAQDSILNMVKQTVETIRCTQEVKYEMENDEYTCSLNQETYSTLGACATACTSPGSCMDIGLCAVEYSNSCGGFNSTIVDYSCSSNGLPYAELSDCNTSCYSSSSASYKCSLTGTQYTSSTSCTSSCSSSAAAIINCPTGMLYDSSLQRCVKNSQCLTGGGVLNTTTDNCEINLSSMSCPANYTYDPVNDGCIKPATCSAGTYNSGADRCEFSVTYNCGSGSTYNAATGVCEANPSCPAGTTYNTTQNKCFASATLSCPSVYTLSGSTCISTPTCLTGSFNSSTDTCEALNSNYNCSLGGSYSTYESCSSSCLDDIAPTQTPLSYACGWINDVDISIKSVLNDDCSCVTLGLRDPDGDWINNINMCKGDKRQLTAGTQVRFNEDGTFGGYGLISGMANAKVYRYVSDYSYSCPVYYNYTPYSNRCIRSGTCSQGSCPAGTTQSGSQCISSPACSGGGYYNSTTNRCEITTTKSCPSGSTYDSALNMCIAEPSCAAGTLNTSTNKCSATVTTTCPNGYIMTGNLCYSEPICATGSYNSTLKTCLYASTNLCPNGYTFNSGNDKCVSAPTCSHGAYSTTADVCALLPTYTCGTGTTLSGTECITTGNCTAVCPTGQTLVGTECRLSGSCSPNCTSESYRCSTSSLQYATSTECNNFCNTYQCNVDNSVYSSLSSCSDQCINLGACTNTSELVRKVINNCPDLNEELCAVVARDTSGYECRNILGYQKCEESWETELTYACKNLQDINELLETVDTNYCEYETKCTTYDTVVQNAGTTTCKIYVDKLRPQCASSPLPAECILNDCGDLFQRCSQTHYVESGNVTDVINRETKYYCDPVSGMCGVQEIPGIQGVNMGIYTFQCPEEAVKYCTNYEKKLVCPDGTEQVCNSSNVCVDSTPIHYERDIVKGCIANRRFTDKKVLKNSPEEVALRTDPKCIKQGEEFGYDYTSYTVTGGWDANGSSKDCFLSVLNNSCYSLGHTDTQEACQAIYTDKISLLNFVGSVWPGLEYQEVTNVSLGSSGNLSNCFGSGDNASDHYVNATLKYKTTYSDYRCFNDSYDSCPDIGGETCSLIADVATDCVQYSYDVNDITRFTCMKGILEYKCSENVQDSVCNQWEQRTNCANGKYPLGDVKTETFDFTKDFTDAALAAEMTNEIKNLFSGKTYRCEAGMWYLFDKMSLLDYVKQKALTYALAYMGGAITSKLGSYMTSMMADSMVCVQALLSVMMSAYTESIQTSSDGSIGWVTGNTAEGAKVTANIFTKPNGQIDTVQLTSVSYDAAGDSLITINRPIDASSMNETNNCLSAAGMKALTAVGMDAMSAAKVMNFLQNSYVMVAIDLLKDQLTNIKNCSTCNSEKCASAYEQYKDYVNINNKLCHYVDTECTWEIDLGFTDMCLRKGRRYCCYNSIFGRILTEGAYDQLGYSWGDYDNPNCTAMTFDDLSKIDMTKIDMSEFIAELNIRAKSQLSEDYLQQRLNYLYGTESN